MRQRPGAGVAHDLRRTRCAVAIAPTAERAPVGDAKKAAACAPVALVTGATSDGIGARVMEGLLKKGFDIVAVARTPQRAERLKALAAAYPARKVTIYYADLALVKDIRDVAARIQAAHPGIDRIVNSLGVMLPDHEKTSEDRDRSEMVNALAPWMLTRLLTPALVRSSDPRVVQLNSDGHTVFSPHAPKMFRMYGADKLTALLLNYELVRRLEAEDLPVQVNSVHPGYVRTELGRHMDKAGPWWQRPFWLLGRWWHTRTADAPDKAAAPIVALATQRRYKHETGGYYDGSRKTASSPASLDTELAAQLWDKYSDALGLPRDRVV